jgi:hypothetical protein
MIALAGGLLLGCAGSQWKVHGGPAECLQMCKNWGLVFAGMVGVGSQEKFGDGATACVCQVAQQPPASAAIGTQGSVAALAGPITAAQAAAAAAAAQTQRQTQQQQMHGPGPSSH